LQDWLLKLFGGDIGDVFSKIVGTFKLSPEKAAELTALKENNALALAKLQIELNEKAQDAISQEIEAAGANIRAEATNGDKFTSRARPTFLYICNVIIFWNYVVVPMLKEKPVDFPEPLFWLFGSVMLGYVGARSWEKISAVKGAD
jgi:hypothetical protein